MPAELHFTRIKAKGDSSFYDPGADIRQVLPSIAKTTLMALQDKYEGTELYKDFLYIHNCFCIFQIRLAEDPKSCSEQVDEFFAAVRKVSFEAMIIWLQYAAMVTLCVYGLYVRRDVKVDGPVAAAIMETGRFTALMDKLSPETKERIKQEAGAAFKDLVSPGTETVDQRGFVVCEETQLTIDNVKALAAPYMAATGDNDWNGLSEACDRAFNAGGVPDYPAIALALAYPTYERPALTVTLKVEDHDDTKGENPTT